MLEQPQFETSTAIACAAGETKPDEPQFGLGPFGREALLALQYGFAPVPCGGDYGKKPLTAWKRISQPQSQRQISVWLDRPGFRQANMGIITGASGLTVIDCDTPGKRLELEKIFGETPIVVATPKGGLHLYYVTRGERSGPLEINGMKIDVKGIGGVVVAPPSSRRMPDGTTRSYRFMEGDWAWRESLPEINPRALPAKFYNTPVSAEGPAPLGKIPVGARNDTLFRLLKDHARDVETHAKLLAGAHKIAEGFCEPIDQREIEATVASVWGYKVEGKLIASSSPKILIPVSLVELLGDTINGADALMLLGILLKNHGARTRRGEHFAIAAQAMQQAAMIKGWGIKRYRAAIETLRSTKAVLRSHKGGRWRGDPHIYGFGPAVLD